MEGEYDQPARESNLWAAMQDGPNRVVRAIP
jgi:hypothetical protein